MKQKAAEKKKKPTALKDRVHQHLANKNDVITEEDLKNIKVGEEAFEDEPETQKALNKDLKKGEELSKAIEEKKATSPWTVLSEEDK